MTKIYRYSEASALWLDYKKGLKYYILKKVKNEDIANELSHEVLMKVFDSCCSDTEIKNVRSWMYQIAHHTTLDYFKQQSKLVHKTPEDSYEEENSAYSDAEEIVKPLLGLLPKKYSVPLELSDIEELKQAEVAQRMNLSLTATKSRIQRARKLLKEKIIECSDMEVDENGNLVSLELKRDCEPIKKQLRKKSE